MTRPTVLLTGADGQVGWELRRTLSSLARVAAYNRTRLDLADPDALRREVRRVSPQLVVNAAAYTNVDEAERDPETAMAVNATAPGVLAEEVHRLGGAMIHYSTDFVFDGEQSRAYTERDDPNPLSVYGRSKLAGEQSVSASQAPALILRTGWLYGTRGRNFLLTMLRLAADRDVLRVVDDQVGTPTWARLVAEATALVLAQYRGAQSRGLQSRGGRPGDDVVAFVASHAGTYHLSCAGSTSWHGFAERILARAGDRRRLAARLEAIPTAQYPTPARRPQYSVLDNGKMRHTFGIHLEDWESALDLAMAHATET